MKKIAIFAFKGEAMCFVHALLNALDMQEKGYDVKLIIEGMAVGQIKEQAVATAPFHGLYDKVKRAGVIDAVCRACSNKMGVLEAVEEQGLPLVDGMSGHPAMSDYLKKGYEIVTL